MMSAAVFAQWCQQRGLEPATQAYLARLRAAPPVRRVQGRAQNVSGTYASRKMGMTIQCDISSPQQGSGVLCQHGIASLLSGSLDKKAHRDSL